MFSKDNVVIIEKVLNKSISDIKSEINKIDQKSVKEYLLSTLDILKFCKLKLQEMQSKINYPDDDEIPF
jgi:hypothetical protein